MSNLSKSQFKAHLSCPSEFWLSVNHPEIVAHSPNPEILFRFNQGQEVERILRKYLEAKADQDYQFQKTVEADGLIARFDVFVLKAEDGGAHIYEVKSSKYAAKGDSKRKAKREEFAYDLGFQVFVARQAGLKVSKAILIALNPNYSLGEELNPAEFFVFDDMTEEIDALQAEIGAQIEAARTLLAGEPSGDLREVCSKKLKCEYIQWKYPALPDHTIFDIPRLSQTKRSELLDLDVLDLVDVPSDYKLTEKQREYVDFIKAGGLEINTEEIKDRLSELKYPLYFLDYETVNPSIPQFVGMRPLEQITFQYSLHVQRESGSELEHHEFLSDGSGEVPRELAEHLRGTIGETGSVVVWYKHFEMGRNNELARLYPEFSAFFESVNSRVFDLYEIFSLGLYRDPELLSNSIKNVLPFLVPDMSYDDLDIGNGGLASALWFECVYQGKDEKIKNRTLDELRTYCKTDTLAMVRILDVISEIVTPKR